jgi:hypothetical protein
MSSFYHGSYIRFLIDGAGFRLRQAVKRFRAARSLDGDPELAGLLRRFDADVARRDWNGVGASALALADLGRARRDHGLMKRMAAALERLGRYREAAALRLEMPRPAQPYWAGEDISDKSLLIKLVEDDPRSLGHVIRHARLAGAAAMRAGRATVLVEPRLVPLIGRTFPHLVVQEPGASVSADLFATFEDLAMIFATDERKLAASFVPLRANPVLVEEFGRRYRAVTDHPLIGLSWGSKSHTKDVPDFADWRRFMSGTEATFVSLQYGKIGPALRRLRGGDGERLIHDGTVDQMVDMDRFAAQIASLAAVVTISNTAAHLAGALGVPTVFIIDDGFHTNWPVIGDRTPWYPKGIVVRREGRDWSAVLKEVAQLLPTVMTGEAAPKLRDAEDR